MNNNNITGDLKDIKIFQETGTLFDEFIKVRNQTIEIVTPLETEDFVVQTESFMSPPRWHLGHLTWFYDQLLRKHYTEFRPFRENYDFYFNSYYLSFGELFTKSRRGTISRPTVRQTLDYWNWINKEVYNFITANGKNLTPEVRQLFNLGFHHEYQHQELLVYDLQHLLADKYIPLEKNESGKFSDKAIKKEMINIPGGIFEMGFDNIRHADVFAYDIEMPNHKVYLNEFMIDKYPVTNGDFLEFINDGGYSNFKYWVSEGWDAVKANNWKAPLYWQRADNGEWIKIDFRGEKNIKDIKDEPVLNISCFEADAFSKWCGKRLPTEAEWEKAASHDEDVSNNKLYPWGNDLPDKNNSNLFEAKLWSASDIGNYKNGKSFYGCHQMIGDCWEWTSSEFMPYPGFISGFAEYNDKWFNNQKVLRGGSFATPGISTRNTYRNFFRTYERWMFAGFRCAK